MGALLGSLLAKSELMMLLLSRLPLVPCREATLLLRLLLADLGVLVPLPLLLLQLLPPPFFRIDLPGFMPCTKFSATVCKVWLLFFLGGVPQPRSIDAVDLGWAHTLSADMVLFLMALLVGSVPLRCREPVEPLPLRLEQLPLLT